MARIDLLFHILLYILGPHHLSQAKSDTLKQGQALRDSDKLISPNLVYTLQFFSLESVLMRPSAPRYVGICFNKRSSSDPTAVVWLANPKSPIPDNSGVLRIDSDGILKFGYEGGQLRAVSSNQATKTSESNISGTLLDSGNLVLREVDYKGVAGPVLWQSFDYPSDTLLPGMKIGFNLKTGHEWYLSSWSSHQVPLPGAFKLGLDPDGSNQLIVWRRGEVYWRSGLLKNGSSQFISHPTKNVEYEYMFVSNENERSFSYSTKNGFTNLSKWVLDFFGVINRWTSNDPPEFTSWSLDFTRPCSKDMSNASAVCLNEKPLKCRNGSEFFVLRKGYINIDQLLYDDSNASLTVSDCHARCWKNCSCVAYKLLFVNGTGCPFYTGESNLFALEESEEDIYLLTSKNQNSSAGKITDKDQSRNTKNRWWIWFIIAITSVLMMILSAIFCHSKRRNRKLMQQTGDGKQIQENQDKSLRAFRYKKTPSYKLFDANKLKNVKSRGHELMFLSFLQITTATNNFSPSSKIGEGGFGPVYKGILPDGQQIAVKRLSRCSGQGLIEFKNEITLIAELQHTNLVKLLGCCIDEEEKMLLYEYMPNKSLDSFLFDPTKRGQLDWKMRFSIIEGISQGLLYLHKYSRLKVIHRDLKASNILLDDEMNPKISDFGMARIFGQNEYEANTSRIVGTYGYMSPEYAMNGIFSVKSDVYSFGILLLEIISGLRNTALSHTSGPLSLIEHAWDLWTRGASLELMDKSVDSSCHENQLKRCIHVGLICVHECAMDRPTMSDVTIMLTNETMSLPYPKKPGFYFGRHGKGVVLPNSKPDPFSSYNVSITEIEGR